MNSPFLKFYWSVIKSTLKRKYPDLTDNDLAYISGREEEVFDRVEQRTGVKRDQIEALLRSEISLASSQTLPVQTG